MILPDINLLVYAYCDGVPQHDAARAWWEQVLSQGLPVGLPWAVSCGFIRIMTDPRILVHPLPPDKAVAHVESWLERRGVITLTPGARHTALLKQLFAEAGTAGRLTTDIHLAALAIEHHAELHSNDRDFARFSELNWVNPLT